jgi:hypothetical protein
MEGNEETKKRKKIKAKRLDSLQLEQQSHSKNTEGCKKKTDYDAS